METYACMTLAEADDFLNIWSDDIFVAILGLRLIDAPDGEVVDMCCSRSVPCIVFTADVEESIRREMFAKNIIDYVIKDANAVSNIIDYIIRLNRNLDEKILIIEDSASVRLSLDDMLRRHMFQVESLSTAESGLAMLEEGRDFTLAVIDYCLPGMDGLEMTRIIREKFSKEELAIIGISVSDDPDLTVRFIKSGANDYLRKPFHLEEFFCRVDNNVEIVVNQRTTREAKAVMNRFLGMASHDLRSPINSVKGFVGLLLEGAYGEVTDVQAEALEYIQAANDHMCDLVLDLLDVSVIEAGELRLVKEPADLCALVELRKRIHALGAKEKNISVSVDCADIGMFPFDSKRIAQVVDNLLTNALKFTPSGGSVSIAVDRAGDMARVCVRDSGQGIPPGEDELLFQSFRKTSVRPTAGESGTGLGLSIVKTVVEGHGGRVWVESEYGYGASFFFTLPIDGECIKS